MASVFNYLLSIIICRRSAVEHNCISDYNHKRNNCISDYNHKRNNCISDYIHKRIQTNTVTLSVHKCFSPILETTNFPT